MNHFLVLKVFDQPKNSSRNAKLTMILWSEGQQAFLKRQHNPFFLPPSENFVFHKLNRWPATYMPI